MVHMLDLNLQNPAPGAHTTVEDTRQIHQHIIQLSEAAQITQCVPRTPLNSPRVILPAIDFAHHRTTAASPQHPSALMDTPNPGFHSGAHVPRLLPIEPRQGDIPVLQYSSNYPSLRRFQCPHCGHLMQEWCANGSNEAFKPYYNSIPSSSDRPLPSTMVSDPLRGHSNR